MRSSIFIRLTLALMLLVVGCKKKSTGRTYLHIAALRGYKDVVKVLVDHGADVTAKDFGSQTPLDEAIRRRHKDIIELLTAKESGLSAKTK